MIHKLTAMTEKTESSRLLNTRQAAGLIGTSEASIRRWSDAGLLAAQRIGRRRERRFREQDLRRFAEAGWRPAAQAEPARTRTRRVGPAELALGSHVAAVYSSSTGRARLAGPFLAEGPGAGQPTFLLAGPDVCAAYLEAAGGGGGVVVLDRQGATAAAVLATWEDLLWKAAEARPDAIRVLVDVASARPQFRTEDEWLACETSLNLLVARFPVVLICQYDAREFGGAQLLDALKTHPDLFAQRLSDFLT